MPSASDHDDEHGLAILERMLASGSGPHTELRRRRILSLLGASAVGSLASMVSRESAASPPRPKPTAPVPELDPSMLARFQLDRQRIRGGRIPPIEGTVELSRATVSRATTGKYLDLLRVIPPGKKAEISLHVRNDVKGSVTIPYEIEVDGKRVRKSSKGATGGREAVATTSWTAKPGKHELVVRVQATGKLEDASLKPTSLEQRFPVYVDPWGEWAEKLVDAVSYAISRWKAQATMRDIKIMAMSAIGSPGCLDGPSLEDDIVTHLAQHAGQMPVNIRSGLARGYAKQFRLWQDHVTVPGLPWYPAFVAFPGPYAPPMPNIPMPLIALVSTKLAGVTSATAIASGLRSELGAAANAEAARVAIEDLGIVLALRFLIWASSSQVTLVMGKGPVPTFAPPYVPVGPVVNGDVIPAPGCLATAGAF